MNTTMRRGLVLVLLFNLLYEGFILVQPASPVAGWSHGYFTRLVTDLTELVGPLAVLVWLVIRVVRSRKTTWRPDVTSLAAGLLAAGGLSFVIGDAIWSY